MGLVSATKHHEHKDSLQKSSFPLLSRFVLSGSDTSDKPLSAGGEGESTTSLVPNSSFWRSGLGLCSGLAGAAVKESEKLDVSLNIAIVDNLVGFLRMDGAFLGSVDIAIKKAKTAVFFQMETEKLGALSQPGGSLFNIEHSNQGLITFPGGVPLMTKDGKQAGGIGVSGSTVEIDKAVAQVPLNMLLLPF